ncbi:uncharacterized protein [Amphiura filiformis]|uniref:uncharacterized protein n=1 Tax=Amphiura filiformis TaxID=82378 RepID=UPI003B2155E8
MVLQSKEYYEYEELGFNTTLIIANEPVLVMQYTTSPNSVTGPSMSLIPSIQMYHGNVDFFVPQSDNQNYVSITSRCSDGSNLMLTNTQDEIGNDTLVVWDRQYTRDQMCVYQKWVSEPGTYQVSVNQSISARFFVLVNGRSYVSYALPVAYQKEGDACSSNPCLNGATCFNRQSRYDFLCLCRPGWEGRNCHRAIAPHVCHNVVCQNEGRCYAIDEDEQSDDDHVCLCQYGWGGKDCTEDVVNECDDLELPCGDYGTCTDAMGKYTCQCDAGYTGTLCEMNVRPGISQNGTAGVIVVAGVIVGCLCLIAVIINVAFITRER